MHLNEYQQLALRSMGSCTEYDKQALVLNAGLCGEAGEVSDLLKKHIGHGHSLDKSKLIKELGDTLWYLAALADHYDVTLEYVGQLNIEKLKARYPNGFNTQDSIKRKDTWEPSEGTSTILNLNQNQSSNPSFMERLVNWLTSFSKRIKLMATRSSSQTKS